MVRRNLAINLDLNWIKVLKAREDDGLEAELFSSVDLAVLVAKYTTDNPTETID